MTDDERRERYAAAILRADHAKDSGYAELADAAMAVADEEFAPIREEITNLHRDACKDADENARLRAELEEVTEWAAQSDAEKMNHRATIARVRSVADEIDTEMRTEPDTQRAAMQMEAVVRFRAALGAAEGEQ